MCLFFKVVFRRVIFSNDCRDCVCIVRVYVVAWCIGASFYSLLFVLDYVVRLIVSVTDYRDHFVGKSYKTIERKPSKVDLKSVNIVGNGAPKSSKTFPNGTQGQLQRHPRCPMCPAYNMLHARGGSGELRLPIFSTFGSCLADLRRRFGPHQVPMESQRPSKIVPKSR